MRTLGGATTAVLFLFSVSLCSASDETTLPVPDEAPTPEFPEAVLGSGGTGFVDGVLFVDARGRVTRAAAGGSSDPGLERPVIDAMRQWTFTPGTSDGVPDSRMVMIRISFENGRTSVGTGTSLPKADTLPKLLKRVEPEYPEELYASGNRGSVKVTFVVNTRGEAREPKVDEASHPAFEAAALAAIMKWKFAPAKAGGRAVPIYISQMIRFDLPGPGGVDSFSIGDRSKKNAPGAAGAEVLPKARIVVAPVFPYDEAFKKTTGSALVRVVVDPRGRVALTTVEEASSPSFGLALAAALDAFSFEPALRGGEKIGFAMTWEHEFKFGERDSAIDHEVEELLRSIRSYNLEFEKPSNLDAPLRPEFAAPPVYPTKLMQDGRAGSAMIEVIIDKKGRAVLPRIVKASEPEFGWAAATAAQRWRFKPPMVKGKPVEMKVVIPFEFTAPEAPAELGGRETAK